MRRGPTGRRFAAGVVALGLALGAGPALAQAIPGPPAYEFDDFADPATGWTVRTDGATYEMGYADGAYRIAMATRTPLQLASAGQVVADGRVAVRLNDLATSAAHPAGLFVRAQDAGNFYGFVVGSDGSFVVFHYLEGAFVLDTPDGAALPPQLYLTDGAANDLAIQTGASRLVFLLNGVEVFRLEEALWTEGVVGLLAANLGTGPAGTAFDDWRIDRYVCPLSPRPVCAPVRLAP